ncbi:MAG TPA: enoyl-CoA hydratase/isomerase family protein [Thermoanaerobaculia bacterium]
MKARLELQNDRRLARVILTAPKANILDQQLVTELDAIFISLEGERKLRAIVIESEGPDFSFGASIEEHLPDRIEGALARMGALLRRVASTPAPTIAALRGRCLGGGFELVLACDLVIAEESATLALPEIKLGVFPPAASVLLPLRIGVAPASAAILTGESWSATRAMQLGLVTRVSPDGELRSSVDAFIEEHFAALSPNALRKTTRIVRRAIVKALEEELPKIDRIYLDELMAHPDPEEGMRAFLDKRPPRWSSSES